MVNASKHPRRLTEAPKAFSLCIPNCPTGDQVRRIARLVSGKAPRKIPDATGRVDAENPASVASQRPMLTCRAARGAPKTTKIHLSSTFNLLRRTELVSICLCFRRHNSSRGYHINQIAEFHANASARAIMRILCQATYPSWKHQIGPGMLRSFALNTTT